MSLLLSALTANVMEFSINHYNTAICSYATWFVCHDINTTNGSIVSISLHSNIDSNIVYALVIHNKFVTIDDSAKTIEKSIA